MANLQVTNRNKGTNKKPNWQWRFEIRTNNGRKNFSKSGFRTQAEAIKAGTEALSEYHNGGQMFTPSEMVLSDYMEEWLNKYVRVNLRNKTQESYSGIIKNHINPALGHYKLNNLNPGKIQDFLNDLKERGYSRRHIINIHSTLSNALKYAIQPLAYIKTNPAQYVRIPTVERAPRQRIVLSLENWQRIVSRFPFGNKYHVPLMVGYYTGMRIGEVFALTWNDIDFENAEISVTKSVMKIKREGEKAKWSLGQPKTKSSNRTIKIGNTLVNTLKREKARQNQNALLYGEYYKNENKLICVCEDGSMLTTDSFKYCSRVIHHELKIEFDFHSLRHTHATILVENGAPIKDVQKRLGHEKIETTLQTYVHNTEDMRQASVEIFERAQKI